jgi:uroporphyrin-III C-methyltransferase
MSNQDDNAKLPTTAEEPESSPAPEQPQNPARLLWPGVVLAAGIAVAALIVGLLVWQQLREAEDRHAKFNERIDELALRLQSSTEAQAELRRELATLDETQATTTAALQKLAERERWDNMDWALAEVEYLSIIAMQRLNLVREPQPALAALEAAARRLKDIDDPGLIPVREQFTRDLNALRELPETDIPGMALYLADLITRAEKLPLKPDTPAVLREQPLDEDEPVTGWRGVLGAVWQELRGLIVIQREDEPPPALLSPDERYFLYQNLRVELASAREAVLRRDSRNLHTSLELIEDWLQRYFDTETSAVSNILDTLAQMRTVELAPELPDISGSLETVRAYIRRRGADE